MANEKERIYLDEDQQIFADEICSRIADGEPLVGILKSRKEMPTYHEVRKWIKHCEEFDTEYREALRQQAGSIYNEIQTIEWKMRQPALVPMTEGKGKKQTVKEDKKGKPIYVPNEEYIAYGAGKELIKSLQWRAERMDPEKYGKKVKHEVEDVSLQDRILEARARIRNGNPTV